MQGAERERGAGSQPEGWVEKLDKLLIKIEIATEREREREIGRESKRGRRRERSRERGRGLPTSSGRVSIMNTISHRKLVPFRQK